MNQIQSSGNAPVADLIPYAPPPFKSGSKLVVPVHFFKLTVSVAIDIRKKEALCHSRIRFAPAQRGCPLLDLVPDPQGLTLNGQSLDTSKLPLVTPLDEKQPVRMLDIEVPANSINDLEIHHLLPVRFSEGGVAIAFFMDDWKARGFLEQYVPANLEFDQFPLSLEITVVGAAKPHHFFTNGRVTRAGDFQWKVDFPEYFTCSSHYLHLTDVKRTVQTGTYLGVERLIPVTIYGDDADLVEQVLARAPVYLRALESTFGPYGHDGLLIYATEHVKRWKYFGNMEYCGAAIADLGALKHEITHSWFGRGVMPANGNAGWIDEAIASWGYQRLFPAACHPPVTMAGIEPYPPGFSPYRRSTPTPAPYDEGVVLLGELDYLFASAGGLRPLLRKLYLNHRYRVITTPIFQSFLERETGRDLSTYFARYVYGKPEYREAPVSERLKAALGVSELPPTAQRFTPEEMQKLL